MKILSKMWRLALLRQVADVFVSSWRELLVCAATVVAVILIMERNGMWP